MIKEVIWPQYDVTEYIVQDKRKWYQIFPPKKAYYIDIFTEIRKQGEDGNHYFTAVRKKSVTLYKNEIPALKNQMLESFVIECHRLFVLGKPYRENSYVNTRMYRPDESETCNQSEEQRLRKQML